MKSIAAFCLLFLCSSLPLTTSLPILSNSSCRVFYTGQCPGSADCLCTLNETCGQGSTPCVRNASIGAGCPGSCRKVGHGQCPGGDNCLADLGRCDGGGGCLSPGGSPCACSGIPSDNTYFLTSFDGSSCSCGPCHAHGDYFAADRQRFGCGATLNICRGTNCVQATVVDYGPSCYVEDEAGGPVIDASPAVCQALTGGSSCGWSDHFSITATVVPPGPPPPGPTPPVPQPTLPPNYQPSWGIDLAGQTAPASTFSCLLTAQAWAYDTIYTQPGGTCPTTAINNMQNGWGSGVEVNPIMYPNPQTALSPGSPNVTAQFQTAMWCSVMYGKMTRGTVLWVAALNNYNGVTWLADQHLNGEIILYFISESWDYSAYAGFYTDQWDWDRITGQSDPVKRKAFFDALHRLADKKFLNKNRTRDSFGAGAEPMHNFAMKGGVKTLRFGRLGQGVLFLWWAYWDGQPNFNDFTPFGPWQPGQVAIKEYTQSTTNCGITGRGSWSRY